MSDIEILQRINALNQERKQETLDFIEFLLEKQNQIKSQRQVF